MELIFAGVNGAGVLDYVTAWYIKAAQYMKQYNVSEEEKNQLHTRSAFVSTKSIAQGEQVSILWNELFNNYKIKIHFAHRTFKWGNEARSNAAVHVVIIGFANFDVVDKVIFEYENIKGEPHEIKAKNINPYLVEGKDLIVGKRKQPICQVPEMNYGSIPNDGGFLLLNDDERNTILKSSPSSAIYIKKFLMGEELINNISRWCLWLEDCPPETLKQMPEILERIESVKNQG